MLYELRTYTLKPGTVEAFEDQFAEGLPTREKYSRLAGFWHTEIGSLNQVVHLWPYASLAHREEARAALAKDESGKWPPDIQEFVLEMESEILLPAPFMRPLDQPRELGGVYELRTYTYQPRTIPQVLERWAEAVPHREKYSPLAGCWYSELGALNRFFHLWPYRDLNERARIRDEANQDPHWPPRTRQWMLRQESKILLPASFSPMR